jgi:hypothetical protein
MIPSSGGRAQDLEPAPRRPTREEVAAALEERFQDDGPATTTSLALERAARAAFSDPSVHEQAQLLAAECRQSRCRLEVRFESTDADRRLVRQLFMTNGDFSRLAFTIPLREQQANGTVLATIYFYPPERSPEPNLEDDS